jgi:ABC-type polysaccharide/polyol phosphate export permease
VALLEWNPFTHFLRFYRLPLAQPGSVAGLPDLAVMLATALGLLGVGLLVKRGLYWAARDRL